MKVTLSAMAAFGLSKPYKSSAFELIITPKLSASELKVSSLEQLNHQLQASLREHSHESHELRAGALALGQRLNELEFNLSEFMANQQNTEQLEPEGRLYRRAVRMVELGADLDEIIQECELPSAEAELIYRLYRQKS